jgi:hypothetical protein
MNENVLAGNVRLTADELREIDTAASAITVRGERPPPAALAGADRSLTGLQPSQPLTRNTQFSDSSA